jgi:hypothetical protein
MGFQGADRLRLEPQAAAPGPLAELVQESTGQQRDIPTALAEAGQVEGDDIEPSLSIRLAERAPQLIVKNG